MSEEQYPHRNVWNEGDSARFFYSLGVDPSSDISNRLAHRSGEIVTVLSNEREDRPYSETIAERADDGDLWCYNIRFADGHEDTAFEDELLELSYVDKAERP